MMKNVLIIPLIAILFSCGGEESSASEDQTNDFPQYDIKYKEVESIEQLSEIIGSSLMANDFSEINQVRLLPKDFIYRYEVAKNTSKNVDTESDDFKADVNKLSKEREDIVRSRFETIRDLMESGGANSMEFLFFKEGKSETKSKGMNFQGIFAVYLINKTDSVYIRYGYTKLDDQIRLMSLGDGIYRYQE